MIFAAPREVPACSVAYALTPIADCSQISREARRLAEWQLAGGGFRWRDAAPAIGVTKGAAVISTSKRQGGEVHGGHEWARRAHAKIGDA